MTIDGMIAVLQAAKEGKQIEVRQFNCWSSVDIAEELSWVKKYRVKPEPREWTARFYADGLATMTGSKFHGGEAVKVREVLE